MGRSPGLSCLARLRALNADVTRTHPSIYAQRLTERILACRARIGANPPCRSATPTVSQRDTHRVAVRHPPCRSATPTVSQRDTPHVAARHATCPGTASKKIFSDPLTSCLGEPNICGTNTRFERIKRFVRLSAVWV